MKYGIVLFNKGPLATRENLSTMAQRAEALGFDHVVVTEHLVVPKREGERDQYRTVKPSQQSVRQEQRKGWEALRNYFEPLATLMYLAGCTRRIRLGTSVMIVPYRNPLVTAKVFSTMDELTGGRIFCGVGSGWWRDEFDALGLGGEFGSRGSRTDEYLRIYRTLWTQPTASFAGRFHQFTDLEFSPKPVQTPLPIWVGGNSERAMRRAAELGDVWHPLALKQPGQLAPDLIPEKRRALAALARAAGRAPAAIGLALRCNVRITARERDHMVGTVEQIAEDARLYASHGVDSLTFDLPGVSWQEAMEHLELIGERVVANPS
ncbi:MAG: TIGR03619 family F420-dependent LLM class oxidoreductase [Candidatus Lambdaproteobacteria bacterium]|nr:TIGR03619 family F420-dependent LLM class oxidoreductase [Candidatus Lambdaproteobacteria bacterium]